MDGVLTKYYLDGYKVLLEKTGSNTIRYTYDIDGTLISFNHNGTEYYYVTNIFGDITHIIDSAGSLMVEYQYDAYGNTIYEYDSGLGLSEINPYRYRGFRYDNDIGLYYLQSRYYNPETGRFINADGIVQSSDTILGLNMYSYAENNPVMNMDPTGYNCVYQDVDGDGDFFDQDGGPCGGRGMGTSQHLISGGASASVNDVYSTGYNSGMGNMISSHGPTSHWMIGNIVHGSVSQTNSNYVLHLPENPSDYNPENLVRLEIDGNKGKIVKWGKTVSGRFQSVYEFHEDPKFGNHYHYFSNGVKQSWAMDPYGHLYPGYYYVGW
ncbi:RHS repeat-associated core domain-containing protein [Hujiaoplasma nucleasis]|uniref:RHS repeat-associated core domain-containing protein n=1 Tax=Hujiaoplasma nucleasis TaxID=2725268 RepID=A0A7L6N5L8_9MOLU|nr:RHS repeat-associated core domain-containing protein [Hujiaoplasma nucleasis]QLY40548.1 RHS repeat-associated core domain-containing protein [Hujiaoplasma nucleasis]